MTFTRGTTLFLVAALVGATGLSAQVGITADPGASIRTREDLQTLLVQYEEVLQSSAYSNALKEATRIRAAQIRDRLENGDFRLGDAITLSVEGEVNLPDTLMVESSRGGPIVSLPVFGDIPLRGVLRSEVTEHLREALSQYIRDPIVRAEGLMRISVQGAVGQPGFYVVPADMLISEMLMVAGGPAQNAEIDELRIERGVEVLLEGDLMQEELRLGRTLDQLNLQAGDQVMLPAGNPAGGGFLQNLGVIVGVVGSLTVLILNLTN